MCPSYGCAQIVGVFLKVVGVSMLWVRPCCGCLKIVGVAMLWVCPRLCMSELLVSGLESHKVCK